MIGGIRRGTDAETRAEAAARMRAILVQMERYWQQIRAADRLPARTDVDPARIDACLPHSFIVERVGPGILRLRVAGSRLSDALGMEVRGMPLSALFLPEGREVLGAHVDAVFDDPAIMEFAITSPRGLGRPLMTGRLLLLPLTDRDGGVTRALGAMITEGEIGRGGRRFTIDPAAPIRRDPALSPVIQPLTFDTPREDAVPARPATPPGRGHLRLVVDNS
ncbi:PAS domain-containing protein [Wenxinia saemankumensis]|uniref:PAS domain-containing protein n=1 Tax=Wenxinia saemankumensis TaxID=1447782 RepID=A0A1M6A5J5_9RHOB|nr:PAS domain-containing protein [Wenxinia saemankumensis]SHI31720.1 PAS domain-containing protein [Wenxinia saemankumensis]